MNRHRTLNLSLLAMSLAAATVLCAAPAQDAPNPATTNPPVLPPLPQSKSPVDFFRELLAMTPGQRTKAIAGRPAEAQKLIAAKIAEYEALPAVQRELRLRVTELRYYLLPLLSIAPANRSTMLPQVPPELRLMIDQRLERWDKLTPEQQKDLLENENWLRLSTEIGANPLRQPQTVTNLPAAQRQALDVAINKWNQVSPDRQADIAENFEQYFELRPEEKARTLRTFSETERRQMERALQNFDKLDPQRRAQCVKALNRLAQLAPEQRQEFLQNAERWQALTPGERKAWRTLVFNLSLPPAPPVPAPPMPPTPRSSRVSAAMATNE